MNRRGEVGKIIISFPTILAVFVVMVLFLIIAGFAASAFGVEDEKLEFHFNSVTEDNPFLEDIEIVTSQGKEKVNFLDALILNKNNEINGVEFYLGVEKLLIQNGEGEKCLMVYEQIEDDGAFIYPLRFLVNGKYVEQAGAKTVYLTQSPSLGNEGLIAADYPLDVERKSAPFEMGGIGREGFRDTFLVGNKISFIDVSVKKQDGSTENLKIYYYYGDCLI